MIIIDVKGFYELRVVKERRVVYETLIGMFSTDDYTRLTDDYIQQVVPYMGNGNWVKLCDARRYKPSTVNPIEHINQQIERLARVGFIGGAIIVDSETLKMQVDRSTEGLVEPHYFDSIEEADAWLKSEGY